jgi:hypothetical protein
MTHSLRIMTAIAAAFILVSCAATTAGVKPDAAAARNPACLSETGSRIPDHGASCATFGRSYSSDDIRRTGSATTDGILPLLDPAITVHR